MSIALFLVAFMGVANFAMHKAVLESGHPLLAQLPIFFRNPGGRVSLVIEFLLLLGTMLLVGDGASEWAWGYAVYTGMNALSAWLILSGRI